MGGVDRVHFKRANGGGETSQKIGTSFVLNQNGRRRMKTNPKKKQEKSMLDFCHGFLKIFSVVNYGLYFILL